MCDVWLSGVCEECVEGRLTSGQEDRTTLELWSPLVTSGQLELLYYILPHLRVSNIQNYGKLDDIKIYAAICHSIILF